MAPNLFSAFKGGACHRFIVAGGRKLERLYGTMIYTRGGPDVIMLQYYLMGVINKAGYTPDVGGEILERVTSKTVSYAAIVIAMLPILFVYPFLSKYFTKGVFVGSLKG